MSEIDTVKTLCNFCMTKITAKIIERNNNIYYVKHCDKTTICKKYNYSETLISTNRNQYFQSKILQDKNKNKNNYGMAILEIIQSCNIKCATCIANSEPEKEGILDINEVKERIKKLISKKQKPNILVISGGEPTIHPNFNEIMSYVANNIFSHIVLITNGIELAINEEMVAFLANRNQTIEVYLQFDSLTPSILENLRGENLVQVRLDALKNLEKYAIPTTLVSVVKRGLNEHEIYQHIDKALSYKCVRGITFQPIRETGRHSDFTEANTITLSEVCALIEKNSTYINEGDFTCHSMNHMHINHAYISRTNHTNLSNQVKDFLQKNHQFFLLPTDLIKGISYNDTFRILVVEYMDKFNYNFDDVNNSAIGIINNNGNLVPLEIHYMA